MDQEHVGLFERTRIDQCLDAFASCLLALGMLGCNAFLTTAETGCLTILDQFLYLLELNRHNYF